MNQGITIDRDRLECFRNELHRLIQNQDYTQFRIWIDDKEITIMPLAAPVRIKLEAPK